MKRNKIILAVLILSMIALVFSGCGGVVTPTIDDFIPSVAENFIGEWIAINPTSISKVKINSSGNNIIIHEWTEGDEEHSEDYYWGEQVVEIPDSFNGTFELNWTIYSDASCNQKIELLANQVLKIFSTIYNYEYDYSYTYTDYFYNPEDENSYIPSLPGVGLYQEDPEFVNVVGSRNTPKKICQYMKDNFKWKSHDGRYSPYQFYLQKEGDCGDHAHFSCFLAHFHGYECYFVFLRW